VLLARAGMRRRPAPRASPLALGVKSTRPGVPNGRTLDLHDLVRAGGPSPATLECSPVRPADRRTARLGRARRRAGLGRGCPREVYCKRADLETYDTDPDDISGRHLRHPPAGVRGACGRGRRLSPAAWRTSCAAAGADKCCLEAHRRLHRTARPAGLAEYEHRVPPPAHTFAFPKRVGNAGGRWCSRFGVAKKTGAVGAAPWARPCATPDLTCAGGGRGRPAENRRPPCQRGSGPTSLEFRGALLSGGALGPPGVPGSAHRTAVAISVGNASLSGRPSPRAPRLDCPTAIGPVLGDLRRDPRAFVRASRRPAHVADEADPPGPCPRLSDRPTSRISIACVHGIWRVSRIVDATSEQPPASPRRSRCGLLFVCDADVRHLLRLQNLGAARVAVSPLRGPIAGSPSLYYFNDPPGR